jgi:lipoprotein NlpD
MAGLLLGVAGCAELTRWDPDAPRAVAAAPGFHTVRRGDTLYQIAFSHRLDWRDLAAWNGLRDPNRIFVGQHLRLAPPPGQPRTASGPAPARPPADQPSRRPESATSPPGRATTMATPPSRPLAGAPPQWSWPADGPVVWRFGESRRNPTGIGIGGHDGREIKAAADGQVVYSGSGLMGYGKLIILKHNDSYLSAYGFNQTLRVTEGERVSTGQVIALMGRGPADRPLLHFEIRLDGKPVDPARFLPAR